MSEVEHAAEFGIVTSKPTVDFGAVSERRKKVISTLTGGVAQLLKKNKVEVIVGEAAMTASGDVTVGDQTLTAGKAVVIATGSVKRALPGTEFGGRVIGTEEAWQLDELPQTLVVAGAGASGSEIASAYARFGVDVKLFEGLDRVVPSEDADVSKVVARGFKKHGIEVHTSTFVTDVTSTDDKVSFTYGDEKAEADWLVIAAGRGPDIEGLGLDAAGIELDERGLIKVDGRMRTSKDKIYAIGDVVPGPALAHKSSEEGVLAVEDAAGIKTHPISHIDIPRATFCSPNVASFGLTEAQAKEAGHDVVVGKVPYGAVGAPIVYGDNAGFVKIVGDKKYGELLGGHVVGAKATDLIQELVNARELEGGYPEVGRIIHGHPTFSEAVMEAARAADGWLVHG
jgi:dihydrolipoamide dehydrogenase